ncbi:MAG: hypothetical protein ACI35V_09255 [Sphingobacterium composti]
MKKLLYFTLLIGGLFISQSADAQVRVNINIGSQPLWGPVGYDYVRYYYMPEIDVYYNVASRKYTYYQGNRWVTKSKLPGKYRNFDLFRTYKVVINDANPWNYHKRHRGDYGRHARNYHQVVLRDAPRHHHDNRGRAKHNYDKKSNKHRGHKHDHRR